MEGLLLCSANYVPLSPVSFLQRAAFVYGDAVSIISGDTRYSWRDTCNRCIKLASAMSGLGITRGDVRRLIRQLRRTMEGLVKCCANYVPLSPISFLERAAFVYGERVSIVYGDKSYSWRETHERCVKLASTLFELGINRGDVVAALAPNVPALYELHFSVPMAGVVLSALNTRLDPPLLGTMLERLEAKLIFVDYQYVDIVLETFKLLSESKTTLPRVVMILEHDQSLLSLGKELPPDTLDYDALLAVGKLNFKIIHPNDECDPISISYTSGSTGRPKGVVYSHRAAYLNSLAVIFRSEMRKMPVFLWTVDMFRCNGWCFTWALAALGGTNICIREITSRVIFDSVVRHKVTHIFGAPTILDKLANSHPDDRQKIGFKVEILVAGTLPPLRILSMVEKLGFNINHGYGMTEALGPVTAKPYKSSDVGSSSDNEDVKIKYREGVHNVLMEEVDVKDPKTMTSVLCDGKTVGEIMFRGNTLMLGYHRDLERTKRVFEDGWYRTGDLGTRHQDGYVQIKDRSLDVIVHGEETISTIEVEGVLLSHPMVAEAAVVGKPDGDGETPCAFVKLNDGCYSTSEDIIEFCKEKLPRYMIPKWVYFGSLPVNATGKIQKFILREKVKATGDFPYSNGH